MALSEEGNVAAPLAQRSFAEIQQLQSTANTSIVVLSTEQASIYRIAIPLLVDKKARAAIPYALEEQLSESVEELHFAFDRSYYDHGHYLVAVCNRTRLLNLIASLDSHALDFDVLTLDWFALANEEACIMDTNVLVHNNPVFCGSLTAELALRYIGELAEENTLYRFPDSGVPMSTEKETPVNMASLHWIAKRLQGKKLLNLCQGPIQHGNSHTKTRNWYWAAIGMSLLLFVSSILFNVLKNHALNVQIQAMDMEIAKRYRVFFPGAKQVISPRFRVAQLLKSRKNNNSSTFWLLLNHLSRATQKNDALVEQFRYQNNSLQVTLVCKDFNALEALQTALKNAAVKVKQSQASSRDDKVVGTLELGL